MPPFRVAAYYLDSGQYWVEDVTEQTLDLAVRRTVDAIHTMTELRYADRVALEIPGPLCSWCELLDVCASGQAHVDRAQEVG